MKQLYSAYKIKDHIPENAITTIEKLLADNDVCLKISRQRVTKLGDYRSLNKGRIHSISVNGNLNIYSFLLTLIHELAHLKVYVNYGSRVKPHGMEWKNEFRLLMSWFMDNDVFPQDLLDEIRRSMINPKAASNSDEKLALALRRYDELKSGEVILNEVPENSVFYTKRGRKFVKGKKVRKRIKCKDLNNGRLYLFSPIAEVLLEP